VDLEQLLIGAMILLAVLALSLVAGAILLRAACAICRVRAPRFGRALAVVGLVALVNGAVWVGLILVLSGNPAGFPWPAQGLVGLVLFLVSVGIYTSWLEVSFGKGVLIRLTETGIVLAIGLTLVSGVFAFQMARAWLANAPNRPAARMARARLDMEQAEQAAERGNAAEAARLFATAAAAWERLAGEFSGKLEYRREQASCLTGQGEALLSSERGLAETAAVFHRAATLWQQLAAETPDVPDYPRERERCRQHLEELTDRVSRVAETEAELREAVGFFGQRARDEPQEPAYRHHLARCWARLAVLLARGDSEARRGADQYFREALVLWKQLAALFPATTDYQREQGRTASELADLLRREPRTRDEARALYREAVVLLKAPAGAPLLAAADRRLLGWTYTRLGELVYRAREPQEGESAYREAETLFRQLVAESPREPEHRLGLALVDRNLTDLLVQTGRPQEALARAQDGVALCRQLAQQVRQEGHYSYELAWACNRLGDLLAETGQLGQAEHAYRDALAVAEPLANRFPAVAEYRCELARSQDNWYARSGRSDQALTALNRAQALFKQLAADFPTIEHRRDVAICARDRGMLWSELEKIAPAVELLDRAARQLSSSWRPAGKPHQAEQAFRQALVDWSHQRIAQEPAREPEYHRAVADSYDQLARIAAREGKPWDAEHLSAFAVLVWKELVAEYPARLDFRRQLARSLTARGEQSASVTRLAQTTAEAFREARDLWKELAAHFPDVAEYRQEPVRTRKTLIELSRRVLQAEQTRVSSEAMQFFEQVVRDFTDEPSFCLDLAEALGRQGAEARANGWRGTAEQNFRRAGDLWHELVKHFPAEPDYRRRLALSRRELGDFYREYRQTREAETAYGEAADVLQRLGTDFPGPTAYRYELGRIQESRGQLLQQAGRRADAETAYRDAVAVLRQIAADQPSVPAYRQELAGALTSLGKLFWLTRRQREAETAYRDALIHWKQLVADFPAVPDYRRELASALNLLGAVLQSTGRLPEAEAAYHEAQHLGEKLVGDSPKTAEYHNDLAGTMFHLALVLRARGELGAAQQLLEQALPHHKAALEVRPRDTAFRQSFRSNRVAAIDTLLHQGQHVAAAAAIQELPAGVGINAAYEAYQAAGLLARCAALAAEDRQLREARRGELAQSYGDRAMTELQRAVRGGLRSPRLFKENKNLDVLRSRKEFQKLPADVDRNARSGKK
jgi:tetratricopeptide (TPR) repeat protein